METNLRPLSLGEILDRTAQLYRSNFVLFAGIAAVYAGALLALNLVQIGVAELLRTHNMVQQAKLVPLYFVILILPIAFIIGGAAMAANNRAVAWVYLGQPATIRGAYLSILPRMGRYLWLMTIATFNCYLPFAVIYAVLILLFVFSKGVLSHPSAGADPYAGILVGIAAIGLLLLCFPALIYAIWMALRYSLAVPASVVEDLPARKALRRSVELSRGSRGRIFVLGLLIAVIQIGLVGFTQVFFIVMAIKQQGQLPAWAQVTQQIIGFFTNSFIGPMYATGFALFYYDQRIRKEGFDIEWMMQAAGMTVPAPQPPAEPNAAQTTTEPWPALDAHFEPPPADPETEQHPAPPNPENGHE
jgi:uncharacterized membrane protein